MSLIIGRDPVCGTPRDALATIRASGEEPTDVAELGTPADRASLTAVIARVGVSARAILRDEGTSSAGLRPSGPAVADDDRIDVMLTHPIPINRPTVLSDDGARLCRPSELVLDRLARPPASFTAKNGGVVERGGA